MSTRPFSAVSDTQIKNKHSQISITKRPRSADNILCNEKTDFIEERFHSIDGRNFCELQNKEDDRNETSSLPSSHILKSLLSESLDDKHLRCSVSVSVDSALESERSLGTKIQQFTKLTAAQNGPLALIPGIKTKPPLPEKDRNKFGNFNSSPVLMFHKQDHGDDFEMVDDETYDQDYVLNSFKNNGKGDTQELNDSCFLEDLEESDKSDDFDNNEKEIPASDSGNETNVSKNSVKNWIQENNLISQTKELELQTDLHLQHLQKHHEELNDSDDNIEELFEYSKQIKTNQNKNEENFPRNNKINNSHIPGFTNSKTNSTEKQTKNKTSNKMYKVENPKNSLKNKNKAVKECSQPNKKPKSILKQDTKLRKTGKASPPEKKNPNERENEESVKSWMSANSSHENFLDFLNKIDELENLDENEVDVVIQDFAKDIPEHDETEDAKVSTYDDIVSILEVLEKQDLKSQKNIESLKEIVNNELLDNKNYLKNCDTRSSSSTSLASSTHCNDFLSYLEEVDQNCVRTLKTAKERVRTVSKVMNSTVNVDNIPKLEELLNYSTVELSHYVVDLSLRLKEKSSGISVLQTEVSKLRNLIKNKTEEFDSTLKEKLKVQKDDYESVIKRHQKFIDQLIADKKSLNQQCEGLISEMKVLEDRYNSNMKAAEQRHKIDLQKAKEMHMAAEKLRREKWVEGKTAKIKEMTVKSLEPELQNMASRHQQEISDLRCLHKRELEDLELRAARKSQQQCEAIRQQLTIEREAAIAHERDILRIRLEKLVESEEKGYQEQRRRLNAEHKARIVECEEKVAEAINDKDRAIQSIKAEFEDKLQSAQRRHKTEIKNLKESSDLEFEVWKNNLKKQQTIKLAEIEAQLRTVCKKERDREIEVVIERLEQESRETKEQIEQASENRLRRIKEKYDEEIRDLEKSGNEYKAKYSETKQKLLNHENAVLNLQTTVKQLQSQLHTAKEVSEALSMDRNKLRDTIKQEFVSEIAALESQIKLLKSNRDDEMQKIFAKVKLTVAHKDELLQQLTKNNANLQEKCTLLENLLEQQRKDYLIK